MCHFFESIRVVNGRAELLPLHQARLERTFAHFYTGINSFKLESIIQQNPPPDSNLYKLRIEYSAEIKSIEYQPYPKKPIKSLQIIDLPDNFSYEYKFSDRNVLNSLTKNLNPETQAIFIQKGMVTDSLYANLVFKKGSRLFTPNTPLLTGVMRESLLHSKTIEEISININEILNFEFIYLINAMLPFDEKEFTNILSIRDIEF